MVPHVNPFFSIQLRSERPHPFFVGMRVALDLRWLKADIETNLSALLLIGLCVWLWFWMFLP